MATTFTIRFPLPFLIDFDVTEIADDSVTGAVGQVAITDGDGTLGDLEPVSTPWTCTHAAHVSSVLACTHSSLSSVSHPAWVDGSGFLKISSG